jgi:hypothetical protein
VAKLLAYADCSILVLTNGDPRLCDCNRIIDNDAIPVAADQPDKQKEISLKADWKYIGVVSYQFSHTIAVVGKTFSTNRFLAVPEKFPRAIFHPPQS